ncbi:MAG: hypothetical protein IT427_01305 [Pirellulales bacterium]|nr:hypothetical protein [Pirellulales bacterium]
MAAASRIRALWLTWFSQPAGNRALYRCIQKQRPRRIMELGLGNLTRAERMISLAVRHSPVGEIQYIGIDLFDARPQGLPGLPLKDAHKLLRATGVRVNLIPGSPLEALSRTANSLRDIDLVVISADQPDIALEQAWFYVPRTISADAVLFREESSSREAKSLVLKQLSRLDLQRWAAAATPRRRAA